MKTNIICMLLVAVLVALAGCDRVGGELEIVNTNVVATTASDTSPPAIGSKQEVLYGTEIEIPAKGVEGWDVIWLYRERFGFDSYRSSSSGDPELLTDFTLYKSESGTKPLKAVFSKHIPSATGSGPIYYAFLLDDVIAITYFGFIDDVESVLAQYIYPLPKEHLSQGVEIEWDLWNDEWAKEAVNWRLYSDEGSHIYDGYKILPSYVQGVETYKSLSGTKPLKLQLQVMMSAETTEVARSHFEFRTIGNQMVFRLYYGEHGEPREFVKEWLFKVPPHDPDLGIDVGIDFRDIKPTN